MCISFSFLRGPMGWRRRWARRTADIRRSSTRARVTGHLFQGRFASRAMDERHLMAAARYLALNPVRAGLVRSPADWRASSVPSHLSGKDDALVSVAPLLQRAPHFADPFPARPGRCGGARPVRERRGDGEAARRQGLSRAHRSAIASPGPTGQARPEAGGRTKGRPIGDLIWRPRNPVPVTPRNPTSGCAPSKRSARR